MSGVQRPERVWGAGGRKALQLLYTMIGGEEYSSETLQRTPAGTKILTVGEDHQITPYKVTYNVYILQCLLKACFH